MKKQKIKASKLRNTSDPTLAKPHAKGANVALVQPSKDNVWGRFYFVQYHRYPLLLSKSANYYKDVIDLLTKARALPVGKDNTRLLDDQLRDELEFASMQFLIFTKLAFEYMTTEMLTMINNIHLHKGGKVEVPWENFSITERLTILLKNLNLKFIVPDCLNKILTNRDLVEHPSKDRLYSPTEDEWKNVHLAWVLSGEIEGCLDKLVNFVNPIIEAFDKFVDANQIPGQLTGLQRGLKSIDNFKKSK